MNTTKPPKSVFTINEGFFCPGFHVAESSLLCGPKLFNYSSHTPGKNAHTGVGPIYQPLQSQQRAVGAAEQPACLHPSLQERTDGNTTENNPDMNSLSPGQKHLTLLKRMSKVSVCLSLTECLSDLVEKNVNISRACRNKKEGITISVM